MFLTIVRFVDKLLETVIFELSISASKPKFENILILFLYEFSKVIRIFNFLLIAKISEG
jgi:hypothetical protein